MWQHTMLQSTAAEQHVMHCNYQHVASTNQPINQSTGADNSTPSPAWLMATKLKASQNSVQHVMTTT
jgi:hypothetical protein